MIDKRKSTRKSSNPVPTTPTPRRKNSFQALTSVEGGPPLIGKTSRVSKSYPKVDIVTANDSKSLKIDLMDSKIDSQTINAIEKNMETKEEVHRNSKEDKR
jgi:hypothetical protein